MKRLLLAGAALIAPPHSHRKHRTRTPGMT